MARQPRWSVTGRPHLLRHIGHSGQPVFVDDGDRALCRDLLLAGAEQEGVALHAYTLLAADVWLLGTPRREGALARWMQALGRAYVRAFNRRHGRSGTLWDGRYRATVLAEPWVLPAMLMLDAEPVRLGLAAAPEAWPWSTHGHYGGLAAQAGLTPPAAWWALGDTPFAREARYRQYSREGLPAAAAQRLREAATKGWPLGDADFLAALQAETGRRVTPARPGRPRKRG
ncbi:transposase [Tepidimonas charontis]|uniref:Transposase IS200-like domain-containing protein n=1 Tax=Tepidimonas charontis TaxID=2267262 RepID=A0A554XJI6_9BURK|nr:transposase [Tepidimonas charontis]TSE35982.1 hypothetical protein Tchar_00337 [Tepidimonas charontis]